MFSKFAPLTLARRLAQIFLLVLFLPVGTSIAYDPMNAEPPKCELSPEDIPNDWEPHEKWAWNDKFCIGKNVADFSTFSNQFDCKDLALSSSFLRKLLTYRNMTNILKFYSIKSVVLKCVTISEPLMLQDIHSNIFIEFRKSRLDKGINLAASELRGMSFKNSEVYGNINATLMKNSLRFESQESDFFGDIIFDLSTINGDFLLKYSTIYGNIRGLDAKILGGLKLVNSVIHGNLNIDYTNVNNIYILFQDNQPKPRCRIEKGLKINSSNISRDVHLQKCKIVGDIGAFRARIGGSWNIVNSLVGGGLDLTQAQIAESMSIPGTEINKSIDARRVNIGGDVDASCPSQTSNLCADWNEMDFAESTIHGTIKLGGSTNGPKPRKIIMTNAKINGVKDFGIDMWKNLETDFLGWKYSGAHMREILGRDANWLCKWISGTLGESEATSCIVASDRIKNHPRPSYIYLAEQLQELGETQKAEEIIILEREINLRRLSGMEGLWQWVVGRTIRFGYSPEWALLWLASLVGVGALVFRVAGLAGGEFPFGCFAWGLALASALFGCLIVLIFMAADWDWIVFVAIAVVVSVFLLLVYVERGPVSNGRGEQDSEIEQEREWKKWRAAFLYSLDRVVPFLSFHEGHVVWFKAGSKLSDSPVLCIYFYMHAILGFAFTTLLIVGLTGVVK